MSTAFRLLLVFSFASCLSCPAATLYVMPANPGAQAPYTNWATAATNIQDAVNLATNGDTVLVTNGTYSLFSGIVVSNGIVVRSVNGATSTIVDGGYPARTNFCFWMNHTGAVVDGFTVTGGCTPWAGAGMYIDYGLVDHCVVVGNMARDGGGVYMDGGTLRNTLVAGNTALDIGGGLYVDDGEVVNCTVVSNTAGIGAGGARLAWGDIRNSVIYFNQAPDDENISAEEWVAVTFSCTRPLQEGIGNTDAEPGFVGAAAGNYRLLPGSPCLNSGTNEDWMAAALDLDGRARVEYVTVDMGAYEFSTNALQCNCFATPLDGFTPMQVVFDAVVSWTGSTANLYYGWDFDNDGTLDTNKLNLASVTNLYVGCSNWSVSLTVSNGLGSFAKTVKDGFIRTGPATVYVTTNGSSVYPYTNWSAAATNLQDAVDAGVAGTLVLVSNGTYRLSSPVTIGEGVTVRGLNGPGVTIIDGMTTSQCFVVKNANAVLDGLSVTRAYNASGSGAVYLRLSSVVTNCIFIGNRSSGSGASAYSAKDGVFLNCVFISNVSFNGHAGGVYGDDGGRIVGCRFEANEGGQGGAVNAMNLTVSNCVFVGNYGRDDGGAIMALGPSGVVQNCTFSNNWTRCWQGGGALYLSGGRVVDCVFDGNQVTNNSGYGGGGILAWSGYVEGCTFRNNRAYNGGGIYLYNATMSNCLLIGNAARQCGGGVTLQREAVVRNCEIRENSSDNFAAGVQFTQGGTVQDSLISGNSASVYGGGLHAYLTGSVVRCYVVSNRASYGAGVMLEDGGAVSNCLVYANVAWGDDGGGVYFDLDAGYTTWGVVESSTLVKNWAYYDGGGIYFNGAGVVLNTIIFSNYADNGYSYAGSGGAITYSCYESSIAPSGTGNITNQPRFLIPSDANFRLSTNSPCIDMGTNQPWMASGVDLDGSPRIGGVSVDMGAYEVGPLYCTFTGNPQRGMKPLAVQFNGYVEGTNTTDLYYWWDFDNNGTPEVEGLGSNAPLYTYNAEGGYSVRLIVSNAVGEAAQRLRTNYIAVFFTNIVYASPSGGNVYPYLSWADAARDIQDAIDASINNGLVLVTNGFFETDRQVFVGRGVTLRSVNGPAFTTIGGGGRHRAVWISTNGTLDGFTITNGYAAAAGAGAFLDHGGALTNCVIAGNRSHKSTGAGVYFNEGGWAQDCVIAGNIASNGTGGGAYLYYGGGVTNCRIERNWAGNAGGVYCYYYGGVDRCMIVGNYAGTNGGGVGTYEGGANNILLRNSAILANTGGFGGGVHAEVKSRVQNCTIAGNVATRYGGGTYKATNWNCVVYYNTAVLGSNNTYSGACLASCTTPDPGGPGNFTNEPALLSLVNPHIATNSPCIEAGSNLLASGAMDIDGEPRTNGAAVDAGCDEVWAGSLTGSLAVAISAEYTNTVVGYALEFRSVIEGKAAGYTWQFGDGGAATGLCIVTHAYAAAGVYPLVLQAWNADTSVAVTADIHVVSGYTNYVSLDGSHTPPFESWVTAATNIQTAIDANPFAGGVTLVAAGTYSEGSTAWYGASNRIVLNKPITVAGTNALWTVIQGQGPVGPGAVRCAYVGRGCLSGVTLSGGFVRNTGDAYLERSGGGALCEGSGVISVCLIGGNVAGESGGGVQLVYGGSVVDCTIRGNMATNGGGIGFYYGGQAQDCRVYANGARYGGGASLYYGGLMDRTILASNSAGNGGGARFVDGGTLRNTLAFRNVATNNGGGMQCQGGTVQNCTVVSNQASTGGGIYASSSAAIGNTISFFNSAGSNSNCYNSGATYYYCCSGPAMSGTSNQDVNPLFMNMAGQDFRLLAQSPCVDTGTNQSWMAGARDLAGNARLANGTVDRGAYEAGPLGCTLSANVTKGLVPLTVVFTNYLTGTNLTGLYYMWDFNYDGSWDSQGAASNSPTWTYTNEGVFSVALRVTNSAGEQSMMVVVWYITALLTNETFVSGAGSHEYPYRSWATAATNIQEAVDTVLDGGRVWVSNGVYGAPSAVNVGRGVIVKSVNGAAATILDGGATHRVLNVYTNGVVDGFTITNGVTASGADLNAGGVYITASGIVVNCVIAGNVATNVGGGAWVSGSGFISNCVFRGNRSYSSGGGVYLSSGGLCYNCRFEDNWARNYGGGADVSGGGALRNCAVAGNTASWGGGVDLDGTGGVMENCTVSGNTAVEYAGGARISYNTVTRNSVIYFNTAPYDPNVRITSTGNTIEYNCSTPLLPGTGNTAADPLLADVSARNLRLLPGSPCLNTGTNQPWMAGAFDPDGHDRILYGTVDIGAHEFQTNGLACSATADVTEGFPGFCSVLAAAVAGTNTAGLYYSWDFDDNGTVDQGGLGLSVVTNCWSAYGTHAFSLTVSNASGSATYTKTNAFRVGPETLYVAIGAGHVFPYTNWADAATGVQAAASAGVNGSLVWISNGVHQIAQRIEVDSSLTLRGFGGASNVAINAQGLSGVIALNASNAVLDDLVVWNGWTTRGAGVYAVNGGTLRNCLVVSNSATDFGGGVYGAGLTISNCVFLGNARAGGGYGGGAYCSGGVILNSAFAGNSAGYGAGLYAYRVGVSACTFDHNTASVSGGGVYGAATTASVCRFTANTASGSGAGAYWYGGGSVSGSVFLANTAGGSAGGLYMDQTGAVRNCEFRQNVAGSSGSGGNVYVANRSLVEDCLVVDGLARNAGGVCAVLDCVVQRSSIADNHGTYQGGGVYAQRSVIRNCLVVSNLCNYRGGGVYSSGSYTDTNQIQSCTIAGNVSSNDGGGIYCEGRSELQNDVIYYNRGSVSNYGGYYSYGAINYSYCLTEPLTNAPGNTNGAPLFLLAQVGDYRLATNSPCRDTGTNQDWMATVRDLDGHDRLIAGTVDMGAYEIGPLFADFMGAPTKGVRPLTVQYTGAVNGTNASGAYYVWDFNGDGSADLRGVDSNTPQFVYGSPGVYTVGLAVSNAGGEAWGITRTNYVVVLLTNVHYVSLSGGHVYPFNTWNDAATNMQDAINAAMDDGIVVVTNGIYYPTSEVVLTKGVRMCSVNGAAVTAVNGQGVRRCFSLMTNAVLDGFTVTNGYVSGNAIGGGVYIQGGGVLSNCVITGNRLDIGGSYYGGGVGINGGGAVRRCVLRGNRADTGGGVVILLGGTAEWCHVVGNYARNNGGGVYLQGGGTVARNCDVTANTSSGSGGGGYGSVGGTFEDCLFSGNWAQYGGGLYIYRTNLIVNCTIAFNMASNNTGGAYNDTGGTFLNTILYHNTGGSYSNWRHASTGMSYTNCCAAPLPSPGTNNVDVDPQFVLPGGADCRLADTSPCIDTGSNQAWMADAFDVTGMPRVIHNTVDIGAYEALLASWDSDGNGLPDWWEWAYFHVLTGTSTSADGDVDALDNLGEYGAGTVPTNNDTDGDHFIDGHELLAGTVPTNSASYLGFTQVSRSGSNFVVRWQSVDGKYYSVERTTNAIKDSFLYKVATNVLGVAPVNVVTDAVPGGDNLRLYRIELE